MYIHSGVKCQSNAPIREKRPWHFRNNGPSESVSLSINLADITVGRDSHFALQQSINDSSGQIDCGATFAIRRSVDKLFFTLKDIKGKDALDQMFSATWKFVCF